MTVPVFFSHQKHTDQRRQTVCVVVGHLNGQQSEWVKQRTHNSTVSCSSTVGCFCVQKPLGGGNTVSLRVEMSTHNTHENVHKTHTTPRQHSSWGRQGVCTRLHGCACVCVDCVDELPRAHGVLCAHAIRWGQSQVGASGRE